MREIALHILDIAQNSVAAKAENEKIIARDRVNVNRMSSFFIVMLLCDIGFVWFNYSIFA